MNFEKKYLSTTDFLLSKESFDLLIDEEYQLLRTDPIPEDLHRYYESDDYISHSDSNRGLFSLAYKLVKMYSLNRKIKSIKKIVPGGELLDIGAGTGEFMKVAAKQGFQSTGAEPNKRARELATGKGFEVVTSLDELQGRRFDVITLWHVLEHIPDLQGTIKRLEELLSENGLLVIAVPNYKSYDAKYYGKYWAAYDVPRHVWHFSRSAIEKLFHPNFKIIQTTPLIFDSYYVSLLSEKYKSKASFPINAIVRGFWSNFKGRRNGEYSSLNFYLKKEKKNHLERL